MAGFDATAAAMLQKIVYSDANIQKSFTTSDSTILGRIKHVGKAFGTKEDWRVHTAGNRSGSTQASNAKTPSADAQTYVEMYATPTTFVQPVTLWSVDQLLTAGKATFKDGMKSEMSNALKDMRHAINIDFIHGGIAGPIIATTVAHSAATTIELEWVKDSSALSGKSGARFIKKGDRFTIRDINSSYALNVINGGTAVYTATAVENQLLPEVEVATQPTSALQAGDALYFANDSVTGGSSDGFVTGFQGFQLMANTANPNSNISRLGGAFQGVNRDTSGNEFAQGVVLTAGDFDGASGTSENPTQDMFIRLIDQPSIKHTLDNIDPDELLMNKSLLNSINKYITEDAVQYNSMPNWIGYKEKDFHIQNVKVRVDNLMPDNTVFAPRYSGIEFWYLNGANFGWYNPDGNSPLMRRADYLRVDAKLWVVGEFVATEVWAQAQLRDVQQNLYYV